MAKTKDRSMRPSLTHGSLLPEPIFTSATASQDSATQATFRAYHDDQEERIQKDSLSNRLSLARASSLPSVMTLRGDVLNLSEARQIAERAAMVKVMSEQDGIDTLRKMLFLPDGANDGHPSVRRFPRSLQQLRASAARRRCWIAIPGSAALARRESSF